MSDPLIALEPAVDPNNRITFLLDWELTMKCNLDCSYCQTGIYGGHDNSTQHPPLSDCLKTIDFAFDYADAYMSVKPRSMKYVVLNVYGGEALHHPNIVKILQTVRDRYRSYSDRWKLSVTSTTNAIVSQKKLAEIIPLIDEFTASYHANNTEKQKQQFKQNLLDIRDSGQRLKCIVMMHNNPDLFEDAEAMVAWCKEQRIACLPKQIDSKTMTHGVYETAQVKWFANLYNEKSHNKSVDLATENSVDLTDTGRACCGGRQLCSNQNFKQREFFVLNKFPNWYCSVNHYFLFIKQVNGEIYVNKDCKMNFNNEVAPIGNLANTDELLNWTKQRLANKDLPIIQCKKYKCLCGLCAPKAKSLTDYTTMMKKYTLQ